MGRMSRSALAILLMCTVGSPAAATIFVFNGIFSGAAERPTPNLSPGTGTTIITLDDAAHTLSIDAIFSGLLFPTTASHIHAIPASPPGLETGPVATQLPSFPGFPLGVTSGTFQATFDLTLASTFNATFIGNNGGTAASAEAALLAALIDGRAYHNIHTTQFPAGEIRANLTLVPEPASWMLMLGGFALAGMAIRRHRTRERVSA